MYTLINKLINFFHDYDIFINIFSIFSYFDIEYFFFKIR